jgi:hypothetical protein
MNFRQRNNPFDGNGKEKVNYRLWEAGNEFWSNMGLISIM